MLMMTGLNTGGRFGGTTARVAVGGRGRDGGRIGSPALLDPVASLPLCRVLLLDLVALDPALLDPAGQDPVRCVIDPNTPPAAYP